MKRLVQWLCLATLAGCTSETPAALVELRPTDTDSSEMWRFAPGDVVESFDSADGMIRVFFTRDGVNAVPELDADGSGVPDAVEIAAQTYDDALAFYVDAGFRAPVSDLGTPGGDGGDGRFDVYLVDFALRSDGSFRRERCTGSICSGYMVQENDFTGYRYPNFTVATRILASHELFHAVQAAYDADTGSNFSEATAVWATERFDASLTDFEGFVPALLRQPERSLDTEPLSPADGYSYGVSLFFEYLTERHGEDIVREIWEAMVDGAGGVADPVWLPTVERVLASHGVASFADAYHEYASWVLYTGIGGPEGETFTDAERFPRATAVTEALPFSDDAIRAFTTSMRLWSFPPAGRTELTVALVTDDPAELEPLAVFVSVRTGGELAITRLSAVDGSDVVDIAGATEVVVGIANGRIDGESARPALCVGSPAEVTACAGTPSDPDAGAPDAGPMPDATIGGDAGGMPAPTGCSCSTMGSRAPVSLPLAMIFAALLLRRARRQNTPGTTRQRTLAA